jgi:hypothetical protein
MKFLSEAYRRGAAAAGILAGISGAAVHCAYEATKGERIGDCRLFNQKQKPTSAASAHVSSPSVKN